jgi:diguanylate cyclase (GGDEF)-like protein
VFKILKFLLENTIFQHLLTDLDISVLYIEEPGKTERDIIEVLQPKCLFFASDIQEGYAIFEKVQPQIVILNLAASSILSFVQKIKGAKAEIIAVVDPAAPSSIIGLITHNVHHFVLTPVTGKKLLEVVHQCLYQLSLEKELLYQKEMMQSVLEFQDDLLLILEDDRIVDCNITFLNFFGCDDLASYEEEHITFAESFINERGYYYPLNQMTWIDECLESYQKIKMKNAEGTEFVFMLRASQLPDDSSRFIVMCTDITELEKESKENERLATTDSLTSIYNRFKFQSLFTEEWEQMKYGNKHLSLVLFDIDNFKKVNDTYGHDYGDLALVQLADLVTKRMRKEDIFARWGGEEFILLMPGLNGKEAFKEAELLRFLIETKQFSGVKKLTCSFGVAQYEKGMTREKMIQQADIALYQAKQNGKNQVCLYRKDKFH